MSSKDKPEICDSPEVLLFLVLLMFKLLAAFAILTLKPVMSWFSSGRTNTELVNNMWRLGIITAEEVKNAMISVDRAHFCPNNPYMDAPQKIGYGQTISAPHMHAHALDLLSQDIAKPNAKILDVGCGSGYLAVVMARMNPSAKVVGIDVIPELVELSIKNTMNYVSGKCTYLHNNEVRI